MERRHARSGSPYEETIGFSRAVRVGSTVAVSGTAPVWPDGHVDPDPAAQARLCWEIVLAALEELGYPVLFYENTDGGHSAAANLKETAKRIALEWTYLSRKLMDGRALTP